MSRVTLKYSSCDPYVRYVFDLHKDGTITTSDNRTFTSLRELIDTYNLKYIDVNMNVYVDGRLHEVYRVLQRELGDLTGQERTAMLYEVALESYGQERETTFSQIANLFAQLDNNERVDCLKRLMDMLHD